MPVQQQMSALPKSLGSRIAQANAEAMAKPVDTGNRRMPAGVRDGIAKLSSLYTKQQEDDKGKTPKGEVFFRASAIALSPESVNGCKVAGIPTTVIIPLCDIPAKGQRKAETFNENFKKWTDHLRMLGVAQCPETLATDPTGQRTEAYWFAAMRMLNEKMKVSPIYITFSTRGWTPAPTPAQQKPEEMVFETWHGLATAEQVAAIGQHNPATAVSEVPPSTHDSEPPTFNEFATPPPPQQQTANVQANGQAPTTMLATDQADMADTVSALMEAAMNDPEGATEEGRAAQGQLEQLAWNMGWTTEQTSTAPDWATVADMALNRPDSGPTAPPQNAQATVVVGSKWKFAKRTKEGAKLKDNKGNEFPPQEVEVVTVDEATQTCTLKTKDGKPVVDIRTKEPIKVKFEWLEMLA